MYIGTCLFHSLTDTCKFALCTFTCVFFAECESRLFRKRRTVCPYFSDKIFGIVDLGIFRSNGFFHTPDPESGELRHYILRDGRTNRSRACDAPKGDAKEARLRYATLGAGTNYTLVEVELLTGRHHQIRAQLSKVGCPIRGDLKYGARRSLPGGGISLHSRRVEFEHPVRREPLSVTAPVPAGDNLWAYFENL